MEDGVPPVAAEQGGVFTAAQAEEAGCSARRIRRRLETRAWQWVAGRALGVATGTPDALSFAWAARLTWPHAVVSHATAATLHGFPVRDAAVAHVVVAQPWRSIRGIRTHGIPLAASEIEVRNGLRLTTPRRTAIDCLGTSTPDEAFELWAWVSTRHVLDPAALADAVRDRLGRHGTPALLALLQRVSRGAASPAELVLHAAMDAADLQGWTAGAALPDVPGAIADVLFAAERVVVEVDGWAAHSTHEAFIADRRRQNRLTTAGYLVLRFSYDDLARRPDQVVDEIRQALRLRSQDRRLEVGLPATAGNWTSRRRS